MFEVRFYPGRPTAEGVYFNANRWVSSAGQRPDRVECNSSTSSQATWISPGPVKFAYHFKILQPFSDRRYETLDELGDELRRGGVPVIDLRKTVGTVRDVGHFAELIKNHELTRFEDEVIFIRRETDGTHGDIWQLPEQAFRSLFYYRSIQATVTGRRKRMSYTLGMRPLDELPTWMRGPFKPPIAKECRVTERLDPGPSSEPMELIPQEQFPPLTGPEFPPIPKKARSPRIDDTATIARDDRGAAITELEVRREATRTVPRNMPRDLIPEVPDGCSDREWERAMLIEQIRYRRRASAAKNGDSGQDQR
jgi:hypothetical protein